MQLANDSKTAAINIDRGNMGFIIEFATIKEGASRKRDGDESPSLGWVIIGEVRS
jgi:hypothetical protein